MTLACGVGLRAIESGRLRTLLGCAALVGLAFNTKTLAAYLVVPGLALGYLVCAPGPLARRLVQLLVAGAVMLAVSFAWIAMVELTPASKRPFVGGSTNNSEIGLTFGYNGFGRVGGQLGGPGQIRVLLKHGSLADIEKEALRLRALGKNPTGLEPGLAPIAATPPKPAAGTPARRPPPPPSKYLADGRLREPIAFGGPPGPLRMFEAGLGTQGAWMLPFALVGMIAIALWTFFVPVGETEGERRSRRRAARASVADILRDRRLAALIVLGGWFLDRVCRAELLQGDRPPLLRVGARTGHGGDGRRRRDRSRRARQAPTPVPRARAARRGRDR